MTIMGGARGQMGPLRPGFWAAKVVGHQTSVKSGLHLIVIWNKRGSIRLQLVNVGFQAESAARAFLHRSPCFRPRGFVRLTAWSSDSSLNSTRSAESSGPDGTWRSFLANLPPPGR